MKKLLKILIVIFISCLIVLQGDTYYGGFTKLNLRTEIQGGETLVYEKVTGDYSQTSEITDKICYSLLNDYQIETYKGFGIFYDNPKQVEQCKFLSFKRNLTSKLTHV